MTREQQITQASQGRFPEWGEQAHALELAFQAGCYWADSYPNVSIASTTTREELIKEVAVEKYGNDTCPASKHFMKGMQYAFDYALQEARGVIIEHFGTGDDYADEVECLLNILEERI